MKSTTQKRNRDFMKVIRETTMKLGNDAMVSDVINKATTAGAPQFYVDFETARRYVRHVMNHPSSIPFKGARRAQWTDLAELVKIYMLKNNEPSFDLALLHVLENDKAPSFYISPKTAARLYYNILRFNRSTYKNN